jgi:group I intron endonuclease
MNTPRLFGYNRTNNLKSVPALVITAGNVTNTYKGDVDMNIVAQSNPGVYCIINSVNRKRYIGSSMNVRKRVRDHFRLLSYGKHHNTHLQSSYNKYGESVFFYSILLYCDELDLLKYEQYFIDTFSPEYNKNPIAGRTQGRKQSEETKEKLRKRIVSPETRARMSLSGAGKKQSEESNSKRSEKLKGRVFSSETLAKISAALKGRKFTPEWLEKNRQAQLGKRASPETIEKLRTTSTGRKHSLETRLKMSQASKGKPKSEEHRQHIAEANRKRSKKCTNQ